jgi:hypothetical protein
VAQIGKISMGRFYGFKLHLIINEKGEILSFFSQKAINPIGIIEL